MLRNILLIHETKMIRTVIRSYILSEMSDVAIEEFSSAQKSVKAFDNTHYDIVFAGRKMKAMDCITLISHMRNSTMNEATPFVIVSSGEMSEEIQGELEEGRDFYLTMPFKPNHLSDLIDKLSDPRRLRKHQRVSIAGTLAQLHLENGDVEGDIVNISKGGILCDVINREGYNDLLRDLNMSLLFPMRHDHAVIRDIWCKLLRIVVLTWGHNNYPDRLRIVWEFVSMDDNERNKLNNLIDSTSKEQVL